MSLLVDTPVLAELRKGKRCHPGVRAFFESTEEDLYLSVLTLGELQAAIERVRARDMKAGRTWDRWLHQLVSDHGERVLPIDEAVVEEWGVLLAAHPCPLREGLLAATALAYDLTLLAHGSPVFDALGVAVIDPFATK